MYSIWCRIVSQTIDQLSYWERLLFDLKIVLAYGVSHTNYLLSVFGDRTANPFDHQPGMPPLCLTSCTFCNSEYNTLFQAILCGGVYGVIMIMWRK